MGENPSLGILRRGKGCVSPPTRPLAPRPLSGGPVNRLRCTPLQLTPPWTCLRSTPRLLLTLFNDDLATIKVFCNNFATFCQKIFFAVFDSGTPRAPPPRVLAQISNLLIKLQICNFSFICLFRPRPPGDAPGAFPEASDAFSEIVYKFWKFAKKQLCLIRKAFERETKARKQIRDISFRSRVT